MPPDSSSKPTISQNICPVDFIGIGAPRCATTWLSECLREHPQICLSAIKEVDYFNDNDHFVESFNQNNYQKGPEWYARQFAKTAQTKATGEFSVCYLSDKMAASRIKEACPKVKLIICLRNPVDMIYSFFWWLQNSLTTSRKLPGTFLTNIDSGLKNDFLDYGKFGQQLQKYLELFSQEQIMGIFYEDIKQNPELVLQRVCQFLEVDDSFKTDKAVTTINASLQTRFSSLHQLITRLEKPLNYLKNTKIMNNLYDIYSSINHTKQVYPPIDALTAQRLTDYYKQDIELLESLVGRDLSAWKKPKVS